MRIAFIVTILLFVSSALAGLGNDLPGTGNNGSLTGGSGPKLPSNVVQEAEEGESPYCQPAVDQVDQFCQGMEAVIGKLEQSGSVSTTLENGAREANASSQDLYGQIARCEQRVEFCNKTCRLAESKQACNNYSGEIARARQAASKTKESADQMDETRERLQTEEPIRDPGQPIQVACNDDQNNCGIGGLPPSGGTDVLVGGSGNDVGDSGSSLPVSSGPAPIPTPAPTPEPIGGPTTVKPDPVAQQPVNNEYTGGTAPQPTPNPTPAPAPTVEKEPAKSGEAPLKTATATQEKDDSTGDSAKVAKTKKDGPLKKLGKAVVSALGSSDKLSFGKASTDKGDGIQIPKVGDTETDTAVADQIVGKEDEQKKNDKSAGDKNQELAKESNGKNKRSEQSEVITKDDQGAVNSEAPGEATPTPLTGKSQLIAQNGLAREPRTYEGFSADDESPSANDDPNLASKGGKIQKDQHLQKQLKQIGGYSGGSGGGTGSYAMVDDQNQKSIFSRHKLDEENEGQPGGPTVNAANVKVKSPFPKKVVSKEDAEMAKMQERQKQERELYESRKGTWFTQARSWFKKNVLGIEPKKSDLLTPEQVLHRSKREVASSGSRLGVTDKNTSIFSSVCSSYKGLLNSKAEDYDQIQCPPKR